MSGKPGRSGPPQNPNAQRSGLWVKSENGLRLRSQRVRRLAQRVRQAMPWLTASDGPCLRSWCELELIGSAIFADLLRREPWREDGEPRKLLTEYRQLKQAQLAYSNALGLTPAARLTLGLSARQEVSLSDYLEARYSAQDGPGGEGESRSVDASDRPAEGECAALASHGGDEPEGAAR